MFVARQQKVEPKNQHQQHEFVAPNADRRKPFQQPFPGAQQDLQRCEQDESSNTEGTDGFVFVMAVGVIPIRLRVGEVVGDQPREAGECIRGAVHGISDHRQRSAGDTHQQFQQRHADVQPKGHHQHSADV